jgi:hypothetical protein
MVGGSFQYLAVSESKRLSIRSISKRSILRYSVLSAASISMARLAGLRLRERWAGWNGEPFTSESGSHVSVYVRT